MWYGKLKDLKCCESLKKEDINAILGFIENNDLNTLYAGKYPLNGDNYVNISFAYTKENDEVYEAHKKYIDVQYVISGSEKIGCVGTVTEITKEYDDKKDCYFCKVKGEKYEILSDGNALVFMPEETHKPSICNGAPIMVKKAVFKIKAK